jgi:hypothetical protein
LLAAHQANRFVVQLLLEILDVAVFGAGLEASILDIAQDRRADEYHEVRLAAIGFT